MVNVYLFAALGKIFVYAVSIKRSVVGMCTANGMIVLVFQYAKTVIKTVFVVKIRGGVKSSSFVFQLMHSQENVLNA